MGLDGFADLVRTRLRGLRHGRSAPGPNAVLGPAEGYRRWSATYGDDINELQRLEAGLRGELLPSPDGLRTLEVGSGTGRVRRDLVSAGADVFVTDLVAEMLLRDPDHPVRLGRGCVGSAEALPFVAESFDLVVCTLTLGHVAELARALGSMVELLRPDGALLVTDFHPDAVRRGWQRSFSCDGQTLSIEQHAHALEGYERTLASLGCPVQAFGERQWKDLAVLFGLLARKTIGPDAPSRSVGPTGFGGRR